MEVPVTLGCSQIGGRTLRYPIIGYDSHMCCVVVVAVIVANLDFSTNEGVRISIIFGIT